nr:hypothetical protein [Myxococcota bacterium]
MQLDRGAKLLGLGAGCLLALGGCIGGDRAGGAPSELENPPSTTPEATTPAFDVVDVITQARTSFRAHDGRLVAGIDSHLVEVEGGTIAVTPTHWPALERTGTRPSLDRAVHVAPIETRAIRAASPFVAETESVTRGGERLDAAPSSPLVQSGAIDIARGAVVEHVRDGVDGVEQSWRFGTQPAGSGDMTVRVAVRGDWTHRGASEAGEHFADPITGLGVSYGHGTWIDASGARTAVPVRWDGSALALTVPERVLAASSYPAMLDPVIGPEVSMGTPVSGPIAADQRVPAVSSDGTQWLVVFADSLFGSWDLRAIRVSSAGARIDAAPFDISASGAEELFPAATWNGSRWIVAWQDSRNGTDWDLFSTTVDAAGTVGALGGGALASTAGVTESAIRLASAGTTTLAVWLVGDMAPFEVRGVRLGMSGAITDATPTSLTSDGDGTVGAGGAATNFLVSWGQNSTNILQGRRVAATGTFAEDAAAFSIATLGFSPSIAWGGGATWLVSYGGYDLAAMRYMVQAALVPTAGVILTPPVSTQISPVDARHYTAPASAWNGTAYLVAYIDAADAMFTTVAVRATRVTGAGAVAGTAGTTLSGALEGAEPAVAALGTTFLVVWSQFGTLGADVVGRRVDGSGALLDAAPVVLSYGPNHQVGSVVASNGTDFLVAWTDTLGGDVDVYGARITGAGALTGAAFLIAGGAGGQGVSDAAFFGTRYVVAFNQAGDVFAVNVAAATGTPGTPYALANDAARSENNASVACIPTVGCLAAWEQAPVDAMGAVGEFDVYARRFDPSTGTPTLSSVTAIVISAGQQGSPDVAGSSTQFLVTWADARVATDVNVYATRYLSSAMPVNGIAIGSAAGFQGAPAVASDGTDFLVVWEDQRSGGTTPADVYGARVSGSTGMSLDGTGLPIMASPSANEAGPAVASDGGHYLVAWTEDLDVLATRVAADGTLLDAASPLGIATGTASQFTPALGAATGGPFLASYAVLESDTLRVRARTVGRDPNGTMCTSGADCTSGSCVDGVCCGSASCLAGQACSVAAGGTVDGMCTATGVDAGTDAGTTGDDAGMMMTDDAGADADGGIDDDAGADTDGGVIPDTDGGVIPGTDSGVTPGTDGGTT